MMMVFLCFVRPKITPHLFIPLLRVKKIMIFIKKIDFFKFKSDLFDLFLNLVYRYLYRCLNL